jgi:glutamate-ammonia-ligase adenylyltransferase
LLPQAEAQGVAEAYRFLRRVEGRLRIVLDRAVETLPEDPVEVDRLARRLGYMDVAPADRLRDDLARHMATIHDAYTRHLAAR